jgi:hypothetical protein
MNRDGLVASRAVATLIRGPIGAPDDKLSGAIARSDRVTLPCYGHRSSTLITCSNAADIRRRLAGTSHRNITWAGNARRVGVLDRDGLSAHGAVATQVGCPVSTGDDKLTRAIAGANQVALPAHRNRSAAPVTRNDAVHIRSSLVDTAYR